MLLARILCEGGKRKGGWEGFWQEYCMKKDRKGRLLASMEEEEGGRRGRSAAGGEHSMEHFTLHHDYAYC